MFLDSYIVEQALLHFIYRDALIEDEELFMSRSSFLPSISETFAAKLLAAAEKYDLPRLKLMCESVLCKDISIDSVAYILALADRYNAAELKSICLQFSAENLVGEFAYFPRKYSQLLLSLQYILAPLWFCRNEYSSVIFHLLFDKHVDYWYMHNLS